MDSTHCLSTGWAGMALGHGQGALMHDANLQSPVSPGARVLCQRRQCQDSPGPASMLLPPSVIATFLEKQRSLSTSTDQAWGDSSGDEAPAAGRIETKVSCGSGCSGSTSWGQACRRAVFRWVRHVLVTAAAAGLVAGGAAFGRAVHAGYLATLDDRDALASKVEALGLHLDRAQSRAAVAEHERDAAHCRAQDLSLSLEATNARNASLASEVQEVTKLNLALQRRLDKAESKVERMMAAKADADSRAAKAEDSAARWEREAGWLADRLQRAEGRAPGTGGMGLDVRGEAR